MIINYDSIFIPIKLFIKINMNFSLNGLNNQCSTVF